MVCLLDCGSFFYDDIFGFNGYCEVIKKKILLFKIFFVDNIYVSNLIWRIFFVYISVYGIGLINLEIYLVCFKNV